MKIADKSIPLNEIDKIKALKEEATQSSKKIKVSQFTNNHFFSINPTEQINGLPLHYIWFAKIVNFKLQSKGFDLNRGFVPENKLKNVNVKNPYIDGVIFKKSQYLGSWELRYIAITPAGLFSFKDEKGGETFSIKKDIATELWTRFEIYEKMLIIKIHHIGKRKT